MSRKPVRRQLDQAFVNKSNALIEASYRLTLHEMRLILACSGKLDSRRAPYGVGYDQISNIRVTALEFGRLFGLSPKDAYTALREAADKLYERSVRTFDGRSEEAFRWISKKAIYHGGEGHVTVSFTPEIAVYLTELSDRFTSYRLHRVASIHSIHSIRLFEMLIQYTKTGFLSIALEDFSRRLQLTYERWDHIKDRVIEPACAELREKAGLQIDWKSTKTGRRTTGLEFRFSETPQLDLKLEPAELPTKTR